MISGSCHCGNLRYELQTSRDPTALGIRECFCDFCQAHAARYVADGDGTARFTIEDKDAVIHYRFAEETTDYLICGRCGNLAAAMIDDAGQRFWTPTQFITGKSSAG